LQGVTTIEEAPDITINDKVVAKQVVELTQESIIEEAGAKITPEQFENEATPEMIKQFDELMTEEVHLAPEIEETVIKDIGAKKEIKVEKKVPQSKTVIEKRRQKELDEKVGKK